MAALGIVDGKAKCWHWMLLSTCEAREREPGPRDSWCDAGLHPRRRQEAAFFKERPRDAGGGRPGHPSDTPRMAVVNPPGTMSGIPAGSGRWLVSAAAGWRVFYLYGCSRNLGQQNWLAEAFQVL